MWLVILELTDIHITIGEGYRSIAIVLHSRFKTSWQRRLRPSHQGQEKAQDE